MRAFLSKSFVHAAWLLALLIVGVERRSACAEEPTKKNPWESAIERFEQQDARHPPAVNGIVFVGSSSIRLWDLKKSFPDLPAINRGFGGSQAADSAHYAQRIVIKYKPRLVIFYAGDNDLASGKSPQQVRDDFQSFVTQVHAALPQTRIIFLSVKPCPARWKLVDQQRQTNKLIQELVAGDPKAEFIDMGSCLLGEDGQPRRELFLKDGLHLNPAGYALWNEILAPKLK